MRPGSLLGVVLATLVPGPALADENKDIDLIPKELQDESAKPPPPPKTSAASSRPSFRGKFYLEDAFTLASAPREVAVPFPATPFDWLNRTSLDAAIEWEPIKRLRLTLSNRINVLEQDGVSFFSRQTVRNDLREGYVSWEPTTRSYLEVGRINVRNGAALAFNPTDFFRTRTLVGQASLDPSVLRQNRLGTLMARAETIWDGGSTSIAFAPKLYAPSTIATGDPLGVDPRFDATNAAYRVLYTLSFNVLGLSPQALAYFELHRSKLGLNVTRQIGESVIAYAEWAGGSETNLITRAVAYGQETGTLPATAPALPPTNAGRAFRNDVATGASWTIATKVTLNLEYHFHQAGFTRRDWANWFDIGSAQRGARSVTGELWYVRGFASDQQEPVPMHQIFVRAAWPKAFVSNLELTGFAFVDLLDGSTLTQVAASYYLSDAWTLAAYGTANVGGARTERGSFPQAVSAILQIVCYL